MGAKMRTHFLRAAARAALEQAFEAGGVEPQAYLRSTLSLEPAWDTLLSDDVPQRLDLVREMAEDPRPVSLSILWQLTRDSSDVVRTHAAQALAILDAETRARIKRLEDRAFREASSAWRWAEAGDAHLAMARLKEGVPVLCDHYLQQAITFYTRALETQTRTDWMWSLSLAQELGRQWTQAQATARKILDRDPFHVRALLMLARLAYRVGRMLEAKSYIQRLAVIPDLSLELTDLIQCWMKPNERLG